LFSGKNKNTGEYILLDGEPLRKLSLSIIGTGRNKSTINIYGQVVSIITPAGLSFKNLNLNFLDVSAEYKFFLYLQNLSDIHFFNSTLKVIENLEFFKGRLENSSFYLFYLESGFINRLIINASEIIINTYQNMVYNVYTDLIFSTQITVTIARSYIRFKELNDQTILWEKSKTKNFFGIQIVYIDFFSLDSVWEIQGHVWYENIIRGYISVFYLDNCTITYRGVTLNTTASFISLELQNYLYIYGTSIDLEFSNLKEHSLHVLFLLYNKNNIHSINLTVMCEKSPMDRENFQKTRVNIFHSPYKICPIRPQK
jgi:hypothetical protein